jgi:hypothetical protein
MSEPDRTTIDHHGNPHLGGYHLTAINAERCQKHASDEFPYDGSCDDHTVVVLGPKRPPLGIKRWEVAILDYGTRVRVAISRREEDDSTVLFRHDFDVSTDVIDEAMRQIPAMRQHCDTEGETDA